MSVVSARKEPTEGIQTCIYVSFKNCLILLRLLRSLKDLLLATRKTNGNSRVKATRVETLNNPKILCDFDG